MKKLKSKTFWTLFSILSIFLIIILFIYGYKSYNEEKEKVKNSLTRFNNIPFLFEPHNNEIDHNEKMYMEFYTYTVNFNRQNDIINIISFPIMDGSYSKVEYDDIEQIAQEIIDNKTLEDIYIGNLFLNDYSYAFTKHNSLIIVDNDGVKENLINMLSSIIIIFLTSECLIILLSKIITNWLTKPAIESYQKQKEFIEDASHELKTPLAVIMASAEAIDLNKNNEKWLNNIKLETDRMNKLITNLLDLSKLENNNNQELFKETDISKLIEKSVLTFESLAFENNLKINTYIEKNIKFKCNNLDIQELISILLDNAIKHSYKDTEIVVKLVKIKDNIVLEVTNIGDEIKEDDKDKIFERFYRADKSRNRSANRYGLGLAIAKSIVLNHNGKITAFSIDSKTTFKITFK